MIGVSEFKEEVRRWAEKVGALPKEIHVRRMRRKWASCSSKGRLTFSYDLLSQPEDFRTYVIVHELLHLRYPNHGKMFRALMNTYLSSYRLKKNKEIHF